MMHLLERRPANCARAFNLFIVAFVVRVPLLLLSAIFFPFIFLVLLVSVLLAGLIGYLAYQCGWHPLGAVLPVVVLFAGTWFFPFAAPALVLLWILIQSRYYLQNHGYVVGLLSAREDPDGVVLLPPIPFRRHAVWLAVFAGMPWGVFILGWMVNPEYFAKFFQPFEGSSLFGWGLLGAMAVMGILTYPLSLDFHRLRARSKLTRVAVVQMVLVVSLAVLFTLISIAIVLFTPAATTMAEQMKAGNPSVFEKIGY